VIDGNYVGSSPPLSFNWNTTTYANGAHTIEVDGKNSRGTLVGSAIITVTVSNQRARDIHAPGRPSRSCRDTCRPGIYPGAARLRA
jgi:hypothetical protein